VLVSQPDKVAKTLKPDWTAEISQLEPANWNKLFFFSGVQL